MTFNFVTPKTSTQITSSKKFTLRKDETAMVTFLPQVKDLQPNHADAEHPAFVEIFRYYDENSKSYFRFAPSVSDAIKTKIINKQFVKEDKKTLSVILQYELNQGKVVGVKDLFILLMSSHRFKQFKGIEETRQIDDETFTLYKADFRITCEEEQYHKWQITATNSKALDKFPNAEDRKYWIEKAKTMFKSEYDRVIGKELDEVELIEKFALDVQDMNKSTGRANPMSGAIEDEDVDFGNLASKPFGSK